MEIRERVELELDLQKELWAVADAYLNGKPRPRTPLLDEILLLGAEGNHPPLEEQFARMETEVNAEATPAAVLETLQQAKAIASRHGKSTK